MSQGVSGTTGHAQGPKRRALREERYAVSFSVSLMWEEKSGAVRRVNGRCVDLSPEGIKVEARERMDQGKAVLVVSDEFGRMGFATVRHTRRDKMQCVIGLKFLTAFTLADPARRKVLARVVTADEPDAGSGGKSD